MRKVILLALSVVLVLSLPVAPAGASAPEVPARFSEFATSPDRVTVDDPTVTFTGRLVHGAAADGIGGAPVMLLAAFPGQAPAAIGQATTDADGRFSAAVRLPRSLWARLSAEFAGDATYTSARTEQTFVDFTRFETRISIEVTPPRYAIGDPVTVRGRLERALPGGGWTGLGDKELHLNATYDRVVEHKPRTDADGRYTVDTRVPPTAQWQVNFSPGDLSYFPAQASTSKSQVVYRTAISGFDMTPEPVGAFTKITARGRVTAQDWQGRTIPISGTVQVEYSADGATGWGAAGHGNADANGLFTIDALPRADGRWRAKFLVSDAPALPSVSATDYVDVRAATALQKFNAAPEPVRKGRKLTVTTTLVRNGTGWRGKKVQIQFRAAGTSTWVVLGTASTGAGGRLSKSFTAKKDGDWRAVYVGDRATMPAGSAADYVDVR